jgi:hypothetical protein
VDESGKTRDEIARADSAADAHAKSLKLVKKYEKDEAPQAPPITFFEFSESFVQHIIKLRSYKSASGFLQTLRGYFGNKQLSSITYDDIQEFAKKRRRSVSKRTRKRLKKASVNRELRLLSRMFKDAVEQRLVVKNPFKDGPRLINPREEIRRDRILLEEEEERLLAACIGRRAHLRAVILAALDTGATKGQIMRLTWADIHLGLREITIRSNDNKPLRKAKMQQPLADELLKSYDKLTNEYMTTPGLYNGGLGAPLLEDWMGKKPVFRDFKTSFSSACRAAKIKDFRFNDLRRTYAFRREFRRQQIKAAFARANIDVPDSVI